MGQEAAPVITLDTSAVFALLNRADAHHKRVGTALRSARPPYLLPMGIMAEVGYLVEHRLGQRALTALLRDIETGSFVLECGEQDVARIIELTERYADLPLGFADACVVACAERHGGDVLSTDADFQRVAGEGKIRLLPALS
jgi:uncharacterized protein